MLDASPARRTGHEWRKVGDANNSDSVGLALKPQEFQQISKLAHERFGLELKPGKEALVAARLGKKLRQHGFESFAQYYSHVLSDQSGDSLVELIDSLTTNHTSFLRERAHFEFLAEAVAKEFQSARRLEVWSAACSSGEEPYSLAMYLASPSARRPSVQRDFRILATDISTRVLAIAKRGVYPAERFREVPDAWRKMFLLRGEGECKGFFKVKPDLARRIEFERLNLIEQFAGRRLYHFIFCRNVMMYFDKPTQQSIVQRLSVCLEPGGYLFVGHSESLNGVEHTLHYVKPAIYRRDPPMAGLKVWS
jgi:chemotaxis protein methyltransferase CheR